MNGRSIRGVVLLLALMLACSDVSAFGQIQLIGEHLLNPASPELESIGQKPLIYAPVKEDSPVLYYTPFFVFENTPEGSLKVDISQPSRDGDLWKVRLTLLISPNWLLDSVAGEVRRWAEGQVNAKYNRYKAIDAKSLIPTEFTYLAVEEASARPLFKPVVRNDISTQQPVYLEAEIETKEQALALRKSLEKREQFINFNVRYRLYARITVSESQARVSSLSLTQTEGVKSLSGAGRAFRFSVSPTSGVGTIGADATIVTRAQKDSFEARIRNEIAADYVIEDPADLTLIENKLTVFLKTVLQKDEIAFDNVGESMKKISAYNFSPGDLTPDRIQKLAVEAKNALQTEDQSRFSFGGSASASFMGFGGSASASYSRDNLKKDMEDKGWKFGVGGEAYIPKSFEVYIVDRQKLESSYSIAITISRRLREMTYLGAAVTTEKGFSDKSAEFGVAQLTGKNFASELKKIWDALDARGLSPEKVKVVENVMVQPPPSGDYLRYNAPAGWRVVGAGAWIQGGHPAPVRYRHSEMANPPDVCTWVPGDTIGKTFLTVVIMKVE